MRGPMMVVAAMVALLGLAPHAALAQAPAPVAGAAAATPSDAQVEAAFKALPEAERTARLEAAGRMMRAAGMEKQLKDSLESTVAFLMPLFLQGNEGKQGEVVSIVSEEFLAQADKMVPILAEQVRQRHAEVFSVAELDQLAAFYASPIGTKFTAESPALQKRLMRDGGPVGEAAARAALPRILERLKAAQLNVPNRS